MGIILSIVALAAGADLVWSGGGVSVSGTSSDTAGLVLIGAGLLWFALSVMVSSAYRERESDAPRVIHLRGARPGSPVRHGQPQPPTVLGR